MINQFLKLVYLRKLQPIYELQTIEKVSILDYGNNCSKYICFPIYIFSYVYIVNPFLLYKLTFLGVDFKVYYNTLVHSLSLPMFLNY